MDVFDHLPGGVRVRDVPVVAATGLPEASFDDAILPRHGQMEQPMGSIVLKKGNGFAPYRPLDPPENHLNTVVTVTGVDKQVHMFGHKHIGPETKGKTPPCSGDRFGQPTARPLAREQRQPSVTGERQLMGMARFIVSATAFPNRTSHAVQLNRWTDEPQ